MKIFCGLLFLMLINRKPEIALYWSEDSLLHTPVFPAVMARDRFLLLLRCWHFVNNDLALHRTDENYDRLFKLRPLIESLSKTFESVYTPDINLSLDEALVLWKGRLVFRQYIPLKRARFGTKLFCLCEKWKHWIHVPFSCLHRKIQSHAGDISWCTRWCQTFV